VRFACNISHRLLNRFINARILAVVVLAEALTVRGR
jgi:hypothetical protein